jgi:circadian clock protein KaiB
MSRPVPYKFRLYIAGNAENSVRALANLKALCREYLPEHHKIEVIDVFREPQSALADGIFMTPTLIKLTPGPIQKIIGNLSEGLKVLHALGLEAVAA